MKSGDVVRLQSGWHERGSEVDLRVVLLRYVDPDLDGENWENAVPGSVWWGICLIGHNEEDQEDMEELGDDDDIFRAMTVTTIFEPAWEVDDEWPSH